MRLVFGADEAVAAWAAARIPHVGRFGPSVAIGVADRGGRLIAACVFHDYLPPGIQISMAADSPRWARRGVIRMLLGYPFCQLGCARVTTLIPAGNIRARRFNQGLGFQVEGRVRRALPGGDDLIVYGLLREEASKWL